MSRVLVLTLAIAAFTGCYRLVFAQAPSKNWKDRPEYDLYESIARESVPARKLELLDSWKEKYPVSDFADVRQQEYLSAYGELGRPGDVMTLAGQILAKDPNNLKALSAALVSISSIQDPSADQLGTAERAANQSLSNLDTLFAADRKPERTSETDWAAARRNVQLYAQNAIAYVAWRRKEYEDAESAFLKSLQLNANQGQVSYWLSSVILAERKPDKYSAALYHMARAAAYKGPGSLNEAARKQVLENFQKTYIAYHGSLEGSDRVLELAAIAPQPPDGYRIPSKADVARVEAEKQQELERTNPQLALWKRIKSALLSPRGESYFSEHMKDAELPEFRGKVIEAQPRKWVLSVEDGATPDVTLLLNEALAETPPPGTEIGFRGVPKEYTAAPFTISFAVDRGKLTGWKPSSTGRPRPPGVLRKPQ